MVNDTEKSRNRFKYLGLIFMVLLISCVILNRTFLTKLLLEQIVTKSSKVEETDLQKEDVYEETYDKTETNNEIIIIVTENTINIRDGAGVDYKKIGLASKDDEFIGTGNTKEASNGRAWFEVYLDDERTMTGWISSKVSAPKDE